MVTVHPYTERYKMPTEVMGFCDCGRKRTATTLVTEQGMYVSEYRGKAGISWSAG